MHFEPSQAEGLMIGERQYYDCDKTDTLSVSSYSAVSLLGNISDYVSKGKAVVEEVF